MKKILSVAVATLMVLVAGVVFIDLDASEATTTVYGTYNVFMNDGPNEDGTPATWDDPVTVHGYNAYVAFDEYCTQKGITLDAIETYTIPKTNDWGSYTAINEDYGKITNIDGKVITDADSWHIFVYIGNDWVEPVLGLGHYKSFADYDIQVRTANIAVFYGTDAEAVAEKANLTTKITNARNMGIEMIMADTAIDTTDGSAFEVTFNVKVQAPKTYGVLDSNYSMSELRQGVFVKGYGSDVAMAFKNAFSSSISNSSNIMNDVVIKSNGTFNDASYGYISEVYGIEGKNLDKNGDGWDDTFYYWGLGLGVTNDYANFMPGFYSPLNEANVLGTDYVQNTICLTYIVS